MPGDFFFGGGGSVSDRIQHHCPFWAEDVKYWILQREKLYRRLALPNCGNVCRCIEIWALPLMYCTVSGNSFRKLNTNQLSHLTSCLNAWKRTAWKYYFCTPHQERSPFSLLLGKGVVIQQFWTPTVQKCWCWSDFSLICCSHFHIIIMTWINLTQTCRWSSKNTVT